MKTNDRQEDNLVSVGRKWKSRKTYNTKVNKEEDVESDQVERSEKKKNYREDNRVLVCC